MDRSVETENPPLKLQSCKSYGVSTHIIPLLKSSVTALLSILYSGKSANSSPVSYAKTERIVRNQVMPERSKQGYTLAEIAVILVYQFRDFIRSLLDWISSNSFAGEI